MPAFNIAGNQIYARPFQAAREGKAMRAETRYQELINEALQRKIDLAPEMEAFERRAAERDEEAAAATRRIHPMLSEQALKDFYLTATEEEIKALERIEAKHK